MGREDAAALDGAGTVDALSRDVLADDRAERAQIVLRTGVEVRCGYSEDDLIRSELAKSIEAARELAHTWRLTVLAKGSFNEIAN